MSELQARLEEVFKECEQNKRQLIGIEELRQDRDARIGSLRKEIDELTHKFEQVENANSAFQVSNTSLKANLEKSQSELQHTQETLNLSN